MTTRFHLPTKPYSIIDAINRCAAATGSVRYAMLSADADYNGHNLSAYFNDYRKYYVCDYNWGERVVIWGERVVIARGSAVEVIEASVREFERQGRGASLRVSVRTEDADAIRALGILVEGEEPAHYGTWCTWRHKLVGDAARWDRHFGNGTHALLCATNEEDYRYLTSHAGSKELRNRNPCPETLAKV